MEKTKRPKAVNGSTTRIRLQCGNLYVTITRHEGKMFEVFASLGRTGGCSASQMSALTIAITMGIRHGVSPEVYIEKLKGVCCPVVSYDDKIMYVCCREAIAQEMADELKKIKEGFYDNTAGS